MSRASTRTVQERRERAGGPGRILSGVGLSRPSDVAVMQAANLGDRDDRAELRRFDRPSIGCVLIEREMSAGLVVVGEVRGQDTAQVPLAGNDDMVQTLAPDRADEPLHERVLPRAVRRRENLLDSHALHAMPKSLTVDAVTVAEEVGRRGLVREGVDDLLRGPDGGGVLGNVEVDDPPAVVGEDNKDEEDAEASGGAGEGIDRDQVADVVRGERPMAYCRFSRSSRGRPLLTPRERGQMVS
jgi:hypothetical protein